MAKIHIADLQHSLEDRGQRDANDFLEIDFFDPKHDGSPALDEEFANKVLTVNPAYGILTLVFNERGFLRSIDLS